MTHTITQLLYSELDLTARANRIAESLGIQASHCDGLLELKAKGLNRLLAESRFVLLLGSDGLDLYDSDLGLKVRADFYGPTVSYRVEKGGGRGQMIAKAVGLKQAGLTVFDATAGLGGDAFVLASLGCQVQLAERHPVVRALLEAALVEAMEHALANGDTDLISYLKAMQLLKSDAQTELKGMQPGAKPDVIYLDPMFPKRSKRALVKKAMQVLQGLVGPDADSDQLLDLALQCAQKRVVVKRPKQAPDLAGKVPSHVISGKANRYDIYMVP